VHVCLFKPASGVSRITRSNIYNLEYLIFQDLVDTHVRANTGLYVVVSIMMYYMGFTRGPLLGKSLL